MLWQLLSRPELSSFLVAFTFVLSKVPCEFCEFWKPSALVPNCVFSILNTVLLACFVFIYFPFCDVLYLVFTIYGFHLLWVFVIFVFPLLDGLPVF